MPEELIYIPNLVQIENKFGIHEFDGPSFISKVLRMNGAYNSFTGTDADALDISEKVSEEIIGDSIRNVQIFSFHLLF